MALTKVPQDCRKHFNYLLALKILVKAQLKLVKPKDDPMSNQKGAKMSNS